jgi:hypothetical protein
MEIEVFSLCDAASDHAGKLNIMGTFDTIRAKQFPIVSPHCAVALRIRFEKIEEGEHRMRINFVDENGRAIVPPLDSAVRVQPAADLSSVCANMVLDINGMRFEQPGRYSIDLAIDGRYERSLPINVVEVPERPQTDAGIPE